MMNHMCFRGMLNCCILCFVTHCFRMGYGIMILEIGFSQVFDRMSFSIMINRNTFYLCNIT